MDACTERQRPPDSAGDVEGVGAFDVVRVAIGCTEQDEYDLAWLKVDPGNLSRFEYGTSVRLNGGVIAQELLDSIGGQRRSSA